MPSRLEGNGILSCLWHSFRGDEILREHFWLLTNAVLDKGSVSGEDEPTYPIGMTLATEDLRWPVPRAPA